LPELWQVLLRAQQVLRLAGPLLVVQPVVLRVVVRAALPGVAAVVVVGLRSPSSSVLNALVSHEA
jgi:hypothetical protein